MVSSHDVQHLFLQAALSRRIMTREVALKLWEKCVDAVKAANDALEIEFTGDRNSWDEFVSSINDALNPMNLEFAHMSDEITGKEMCALVNRKGDEVAQLATDYSALEITYFKAVLHQIATAPNEAFCISSMAALRETNNLNMTKSQAEVVLSSFVAKGWLVKSRRGRYSFSLRSLLELLPYLKSTYPNNLLECTICMEVVTRGISCYTNNCHTNLHAHCFEKYRRRSQNCPTCQANWSTEANARKLDKIGEAAYKEGQDAQRRRPLRERSDSDDDDDDDDVEPSQQSQSQPSQPQPSQSQPSGTQKRNKKKAVREEDMKTEEEDQEEDEPEPEPRRTQKRKSRR
ncbi:Nse1 non-SMC component of SMC5-6 complex-domain-containing protein [Fomitopsis betulina]|nr:Nse1 non-SMC component of SMC5-6 complex-domain-containing protein [Fomitopsis betulina]